MRGGIRLRRTSANVLGFVTKKQYVLVLTVGGGGAALGAPTLMVRAKIDNTITKGGGSNGLVNLLSDYISGDYQQTKSSTKERNFAMKKRLISMLVAVVVVFSLSASTALALDVNSINEEVVFKVKNNWTPLYYSKDADSDIAGYMMANENFIRTVSTSQNGRWRGYAGAGSHIYTAEDGYKYDEGLVYGYISTGAVTKALGNLSL